MRKTTLFLLFISLLIQVKAQEKSKRKEVGLSLSNFDNFGVVYRFGHEKALWRISSANTFIRKSETRTPDAITTNRDNSYSLRFGREFRTMIDQKNQIRWGLDASYRYRKDLREFGSRTTDSLDRIDRDITNVVGLHAVIGMNFPMGDRLLLGVEILPSFTYEFGTEYEYLANISFEQEFDVSRSNFSLSNDGAIIVLTYNL